MAGMPLGMRGGLAGFRHLFRLGGMRVKFLLNAFLKRFRIQHYCFFLGNIINGLADLFRFFRQGRATMLAEACFRGIFRAAKGAFAHGPDP